MMIIHIFQSYQLTLTNQLCLLATISYMSRERTENPIMGGIIGNPMLGGSIGIQCWEEA
jgi:hypothetical protein